MDQLGSLDFFSTSDSLTGSDFILVQALMLFLCKIRAFDQLSGQGAAFEDSVGRTALSLVILGIPFACMGRTIEKIFELATEVS